MPEVTMLRLPKVADHLAGQLDAVALRHDDVIHVKHRLMWLHDFIVERLLPGESVLDSRCGVGAAENSMGTRTEAVVTVIQRKPAPRKSQRNWAM